MTIERSGAALWSKAIAPGADAMCHSLANIEHHHFKFEGHRRPGDVHVHFFGADCLSLVKAPVEDGDVMDVRCDGFGRRCAIRCRVAAPSRAAIAVSPL